MLFKKLRKTRILHNIIKVGKIKDLHLGAVWWCSQNYVMLFKKTTKTRILHDIVKVRKIKNIHSAVVW